MNTGGTGGLSPPQGTGLRSESPPGPQYPGHFEYPPELYPPDWIAEMLGDRLQYYLRTVSLSQQGGQAEFDLAKNPIKNTFRVQEGGVLSPTPQALDPRNSATYETRTLSQVKKRAGKTRISHRGPPRVLGDGEEARQAPMSAPPLHRTYRIRYVPQARFPHRKSRHAK